MLLILGAALVVSTAVAGLAVGGRIGPAAERGAAIVIALVANGAVFLTVFAVLTAAAAPLSATCCPASGWRRSGRSSSSRSEAGTSST